jgi:hypothetical protein
MKKLNNGSVNAALVILAIGAGLIMSLKPWHVYKAQQAETQKEVQEMNRSERTRTELLQQEAAAQTSVGKEEMARNLGYVRAGQKPIDQP